MKEHISEASKESVNVSTEWGENYLIFEAWQAFSFKSRDEKVIFA